jgi:hypothetical protein
LDRTATLRQINAAAPWAAVEKSFAGETAMLTYDDCLALSGLTTEEVAAIAAHEHVPEIVALGSVTL